MLHYFLFIIGIYSLQNEKSLLTLCILQSTLKDISVQIEHFVNCRALEKIVHAHYHRDTPEPSNKELPGCRERYCGLAQDSAGLTVAELRGSPAGLQ